MLFLSKDLCFVLRILCFGECEARVCSVGVGVRGSIDSVP
jgi:hypothetical protein